MREGGREMEKKVGRKEEEEGEIVLDQSKRGNTANFSRLSVW